MCVCFATAAAGCMMEDTEPSILGIVTEVNSVL